MKLTKEQFAILCHHILIGNYDGKEDKFSKSIDYMEQKLVVLDMGYFAIQALHPLLRLYVVEYLKKWNYELPKEIKDILETVKKINK